MSEDKRILFDQAMREANSAAWDQDWQRAISGYGRALQAVPDDTAALNSIGLAFTQLRRYKDALRAYSRAATVDPTDLVAVERTAALLEQLDQHEKAAQAHYRAAVIHLKRQDRDAALKSLMRSVALSPTLLPAHQQLARLYAETSNNAAAVREYLAVSRLSQRKGDFAGAVHAAEQAQALAPGDRQIGQNLDALQTGGELPDSYIHTVTEDDIREPDKGPAFSGFMLSELGADTLDSHTERSVSSPLDDVRGKALELLANAVFEVGMGDSSAGTNPLTLATGDRQRIVLNLSKAIDAQTRKAYKDAVDAYERAIKAGLDHASIHLTVGAIHLDQRDYGKAIKRFKGATGHIRYAAGAHYGLGLAYGRAKKMTEAASQLLQCLRLVDMKTVHERQARELGDRYDTIAASLAQDFDSAQIQQLAEGLVRFLSGPNWFERAQQARRQLTSQSGDRLVPLAELLSIPGAEHVFASMELIERYMAHGYIEPAIDEAFYAISHAPSYLPMHLKLAEVYQQAGKTQAAITKYSIVGELYMVRGETEKAGEIMSTMVKLAPMDLGARNKLIKLLLSQNKQNEAVQQYIDMAEVYYRLASLEKCRETYANALRLAQRTNVDQMLVLRILHRIGDIDLQRLDWRQAVRMYEQIRTLAPHDEKAHRNLARLYLRLGQNRQGIMELDALLQMWLPNDQIDEAVGFVEGLVSDYGRDMALRARLARLYQQQGRIDDAINQLDQLGDMQLNAGYKREAIQTIKRILSLNPPNVAEYRDLLMRLEPSS